MQTPQRLSLALIFLMVLIWVETDFYLNTGMLWFNIRVTLMPTLITLGIYGLGVVAKKLKLLNYEIGLETLHIPEWLYEDVELWINAHDIPRYAIKPKPSPILFPTVDPRKEYSVLFIAVLLLSSVYGASVYQIYIQQQSHTVTYTVFDTFMGPKLNPTYTYVLTRGAGKYCFTGNWTQVFHNDSTYRVTYLGMGRESYVILNYSEELPLETRITDLESREPG